MMTVPQRLAALRAAMAQAGCDAFLMPSSDPHSSEYAPAHYTAWEYFSGFSCENSNLVVTADEAALWVDGRFFGAADAALAGTGIASMHMGVKGVPTLNQWLSSRRVRPWATAQRPCLWAHFGTFRKSALTAAHSSGICLWWMWPGRRIGPSFPLPLPGFWMPLLQGRPRQKSFPFCGKSSVPRVAPLCW